MLEKKCGKCEIIKDIKEFYKNRSSKDGYRNNCKGCVNIYQKKYYEENRDRILENTKIYKEENKDRISEYDREYYEENKDRLNEYDKVYYKENKDRIMIVKREYSRNRISNDPLYKLRNRVSSSIRRSLKDGGYTKNSKSRDILGCSYEELLDHLNDNKYGFVYGDDNLDIDHIIPLSRATSEEEIIELNHYSNLQLLPSEYNRYVKIDKDFDIECLEEWLSNKKISDLGI